MSVSSVKRVAVKNHQFGGNRHFRKAHLPAAGSYICCPELNHADLSTDGIGIPRRKFLLPAADLGLRASCTNSSPSMRHGADTASISAGKRFAGCPPALAAFSSLISMLRNSAVLLLFRTYRA